MAVKFLPPTKHKSASYTVNPSVDNVPHTKFTTQGATGAVTFTLPTPKRTLLDYAYEFFNFVDQNMIVSAGAGNGISVNNASCASLAASTGGQKIGARITATCVESASGTYKWFLVMESTGTTGTVA